MKEIKNIRLRWEGIIIPLTIFVGTIVLYNIIPSILLEASESVITTTKKIIMGIAFLFAGWVVNKIINIFIKYSIRKKNLNEANNLHARKTHTRMRYVRIVINIIVFLVSLALALRQFEAMRQLSTSILASAGIIGIMLAFSAQKLLANLLAGFEIAFTQPIRIDDVVIVEGEWGRIEEINSTHVIVKIWDQRRLVLPITHFVEKPFQNWTKTSADIWGTTEFFVDYNMPVDKMRKELTKILKTTPLWDGKVNSLQVTDTSEKTMKVRALMSAKNSGDAWDLRCYVREQMIAFLQKNYPEHLPQLRANIMQQEKKNNKQQKSSKSKKDVKSSKSKESKKQ
jgi:small-conductance mechanosensitive channel